MALSAWQVAQVSVLPVRPPISVLGGLIDLRGCKLALFCKHTGRTTGPERPTLIAKGGGSWLPPRMEQREIVFR